MDNEYYGVASTPMDDFLAHYGVRGMKWGVRKALQNGNSKSLDRQYKKAAKKLAKLNERTNVEAQSKKAKKYSKLSGVGAAIGAAGIGGTIGAGIRMTKHLNTAKELDAAHKKLIKDSDDLLSARIRDGERRLKLVAQEGKYNSYDQKWKRDQAFDKLKKDFNDAVTEDEKIYDANNAALKSKLNDTVSRFDRANAIRKASNVAGALGLIGSGIAGAKAIAAKNLTTEKGHAKAVAERDAWKNEMKSAFKGTKYAGQYSVPAKKRRKK